MYSIIMNPCSGSSKAPEILKEIESLLKSRGVSYRVDLTECPGDGTRLARKAVSDGLDGIIAMGGDGTFSEIVNGIGESGIELIFAPCGTGNDFMRMFSLPKDVLEAVKLQLDSPVRMIDIGKLNDRYFLNVAGCGFDVDVLIEADRFKSTTSSLGAYLRGAYCAIKKYRPMDIVITIDDEAPTKLKATIVSVGNGSYIGGGMKAVPGASVSDGHFDLMIAGRVTKLSIYVLLLLFVAGKHTLVKRIVTMRKCRKVRIQSVHMNLEADGEILKCDEAYMQIIPAVLKTRLPV